jgi:hypothetical protein
VLTPFLHRLFSPRRKLSKLRHAESPESTTMAGDNRAGLLHVALDDRDLVLLRAKAVSSESLGARAGRSSPQQGRQSLWHEQTRTPVSRCDSTPNLAPRGTRRGASGESAGTLPQSSFATVATRRGEEQSLTLQRPQARPGAILTRGAARGRAGRTSRRLRQNAPRAPASTANAASRSSLGRARRSSPWARAPLFRAEAVVSSPQAPDRGPGRLFDLARVRRGSAN